MSQDHSEQHPARDGEKPSAAKAQASSQDNDSEQVDESGFDQRKRPDAEPLQAPAGDELAQLRETMLRMRADMENREKRLQREMDRSRKFAIDSLLRDLVPALDSLDQALAVAADSPDPTSSEGLELTRKQLLVVLEKHGLKVLDPIGEKFDPSWHEAMTMRPAGEGEEADTVAEVLQKGYLLNERLIRPARVIVVR